MIHLGDITKIKGDQIPIVDVITGGSPCQDLSVAGKRAGLDGERSGLFMEQIRIVKEMREYDRRANKRTGYMVRPRYMVWENVGGALSSPGGENRGRDFQAVLTEIVRVVEPHAPYVSMPKKNKWPNSGLLYDDMGGWSVAWRVHDAQYWGVPQRRKRIALVADFGGLSAGELLFEREGLRWDPEASRETGQATTGDIKASTRGASSYTLKIRGGCSVDSNGKGAGKGALIQTEKSGTLGVSQDQTLFTIEGNGSRESHHGDGYKQSDIMYTLNATEHHAIAAAVCYSQDAYDKFTENTKAPTLKAQGGTYGGGSETLIISKNNR